MDHLIFRTVKPISKPHHQARQPEPWSKGLTIDGRLALIYSLDGLNDARNAKGCCCCGGNEIREASRRQHQHPRLRVALLKQQRRHAKA